MGKASSAKKVARAARAGGTRRAGQRRPLGFPLTIAAVVILGVLLVGFARNQRDVNAKPEVGDHWHAAYGVYTCIAQAGTDQPTTPSTEPVETTTSSTDTTTTTAPTSTTAPTTTSSETGAGAGLSERAHRGVAQDPTTPTTDTTTTTAPTDSTTTSAPGDTTTTTESTTTTTLAPGEVRGEFQPPLNDAFEDEAGIHTHGDNVMHIHPFNSSVAGRKATLDKFLTQVGVVLNDETLTLPSGKVFTEGTTKCEGGKDGIIQVAVWDKASDAAGGSKPNKVLTSDVTDVHLENGQAITIAFLPENQAVPADKDVASKLEELGAIDSGTTSTSEPSETDGTDATDPSDSTDSTDSTTTTASTVPGDTSSTTSTTAPPGTITPP